MRVAHFIHRYPPALGGAEAYFARLSRFLASAGDEVTVFTTNAVDLAAFWSRHFRCLPSGETMQDGVEVRRYSLWRWPGQKYVLKSLSLLPHRFWRCLALPCNPIVPGMWLDAGRIDRPFDLVHAAAFPNAWPIACGLRLARRLKIPFLLTPFLHLGDPDDPHDPTRRAFTQPALMYLAKAAERIFVQTRIEKSALLELGIRSKKLEILGMGVDSEECTGGDRDRARRAWSIPLNQVVIGHLANQSKEKGTVDLLQAAEMLWQKGVSFHLVLAGPEMPNFSSLSVARGQRQEPTGLRATDYGPLTNDHSLPFLHRLGVLSEEQKRDFYAGIDVFSLPSRVESFGLVLLEAWANGLPNLAYRAGGVAEIIHDEEDGLLAPCGDVARLACALERLIRDEGLRRRLGQAGQQRVCHEFQWKGTLERVREVYAETCVSRSVGTLRARNASKPKITFPPSPP